MHAANPVAVAVIADAAVQVADDNVVAKVVCGIKVVVQKGADLAKAVAGTL